MNIAYSPGSVPDGVAYDTYVLDVDASSGGNFEHIITDLIPGNVSRAGVPIDINTNSPNVIMVQHRARIFDRTKHSIRDGENIAEHIGGEYR